MSDPFTIAKKSRKNFSVDNIIELDVLKETFTYTTTVWGLGITPPLIVVSSYGTMKIYCYSGFLPMKKKNKPVYKKKKLIFKL